MNRKTSDFEKKEFIKLVVNELNKRGEKTNLSGISDLSKQYKKAQVVNRSLGLGVVGRKTDRFGESKKEREDTKVIEVSTKEVFKDIDIENNKKFIKEIEKADNFKESSNFEAVTMATSEEVVTTSKGVELLQKALEFGITSFKVEFIKDNDIEIKEVGKKDGVSYFYCVGVDSFINVER